MTRTSILSALVCGLTACGVTGRTPSAVLTSVQKAPGNRRSTIRSVLPLNVRVVVMAAGTGVRSASGVVVGNATTPEGALSYVITNAHVVSTRANEDLRFMVLIDLPTGTRELGAKVVAQGSVPDTDLAVLAVPGIALDPAVLAADDDLSIGDDVVIIAAPYGRSLSVSGGIISQVDFDKERLPTMIKTDAAIGYGASGGGLFGVESGKLVGIVEGYRTAKVSIPLAQDTYSFDVPMPGETFAAPAAKIRRFLVDKGLAHLADSVAPQKHVASAPP